MGLLNPTFFAATFAALYLCLDPLRKAINVLRCFYGSSLRSGEDLQVQLKAVRRAAALAASVLLFLGVLAPTPAHAAMKEHPRVSATELSQSLDDVLERREYAWRAPRDSEPIIGNMGGFSIFPNRCNASETNLALNRSCAS